MLADQLARQIRASVNLSAPRGTFIHVYGRSGAGKTRLLAELAARIPAAVWLGFEAETGRAWPAETEWTPLLAAADVLLLDAPELHAHDTPTVARAWEAIRARGGVLLVATQRPDDIDTFLMPTPLDALRVSLDRGR